MHLAGVLHRRTAVRRDDSAARRFKNKELHGCDCYRRSTEVFARPFVLLRALYFPTRGTRSSSTGSDLAAKFQAGDRRAKLNWESEDRQALGGWSSTCFRFDDGDEGRHKKALALN